MGGTSGRTGKDSGAFKALELKLAGGICRLDFFLLACLALAKGYKIFLGLRESEVEP